MLVRILTPTSCTARPEPVEAPNPLALRLSKPVLSRVEGGFVAPAAVIA